MSPEFRAAERVEAPRLLSADTILAVLDHVADCEGRTEVGPSVQIAGTWIVTVTIIVEQFGNLTCSGSGRTVREATSDACREFCAEFDLTKSDFSSAIRAELRAS